MLLPGFKGFVFPEHVLYQWQYLLFLALYTLADYQSSLDWIIVAALFLCNLVVMVGAVCSPFLSGRVLVVAFWGCLGATSVQLLLLLIFLPSLDALLMGHHFWLAGIVLVTLGLFGKWQRKRGQF